MQRQTKIILSLFIGAILLASTTLAANAQKKESVPGWGYGDNNHVHVGPPGLSVRPGSVNASWVADVVNGN